MVPNSAKHHCSEKFSYWLLVLIARKATKDVLQVVKSPLLLFSQTVSEAHLPDVCWEIVAVKSLKKFPRNYLQQRAVFVKCVGLKQTNKFKIFEKFLAKGM